MQQRAGDWECPNPYVSPWTAVFICFLTKMSFKCIQPSLFTGVVATRTLPGGWSATSAKLPNQKGWAEAPRSHLVVTEAEVEWECVVAEVWTVVGQQELEAQAALEVSVEAGEETVVDSEDVEEWIGEVSAGRGVEVHPWTEWAAEVEEEWAHQVARWT